MKITRQTRFGLVMGLIAQICTGCASSHAVHGHATQADEVPRLTRPHLDMPAEISVTQEPACLEDLLTIAVRHHPDLRAAEARIEAARGRMIQAGLYPNPNFGPNFSQLGDTANALGEPGARMSQVFVTAHKLKIARAAGAHGVEAADWQAITRWFEVITRVRLSYFEYLTALRERDTALAIVRVSREVWQTATSLDKAGVGNRPDVLRAKVELEQNLLKAEVSLRRVEAAQQNLLTALGRPAITLTLLEKKRQDLEQAPPEYDWKAMLDCVRQSSSELQEARALIAQQEKLLDKAHADACPNVTVTAIPFYESPQRAMHGEIFMQVPIPIFDRNQGNIHAAKADLARSHADEYAVELRVTERLTAAYQRYQAARQQTDSYRQNIVPEARESLRLIEAGYKGGDRKYDYTTVLQAQQTLFQAELAQTQALGELWRAIADLAGILQQENFLAGCGPVAEHPTILPNP